MKTLRKPLFDRLQSEIMNLSTILGSTQGRSASTMAIIDQVPNTKWKQNQRKRN